MRQKHLHDEELPSDDESEIQQDQEKPDVTLARRKSRWRAVCTPRLRVYRP